MTHNYVPQPVDTSAVELGPEVLELSEKLARDCHENWAQQRLSDGWRPGPARDDTQKVHPCLVPYDELPEGEKAYDRLTVMGALRLITALGYRIVPVEGD
jgi:hypothetical protein